ncbi:MAG: sulfurtransferase [Candidatus Poribacteria bacterium]|nr:MAG: sulfurtransferase [Candidatus Poribacteria bacterium]
MAEYAHPEMLVSTEWVAEHLNDPGIRIVEVDVDTSAYEEGHIPGAIGWNWQTQLCDQVRRDILSREAFEQLMSESGISNDTTIVFYGDNNNWFATYALWQVLYWGHPESQVRLMNGGRKKWIAEGRPLTKEVPSYPRTNYKAHLGDENIRAYSWEVLNAIRERNANLVDVRSVPEYTGEILAPPGLPETAQRGGHIPGAINVPWSMAVNEDGTFKSPEELWEIYGKLDPEKETIAYCRIGERSSHTWFVLKYLLGFDKVQNYDGSWTEWGNLVGAPIVKGEEPG